MIEDKTVFVLGAGASCPYGYPSGKDLRKEIISDFCAQYQRCIDAHPLLQPNLGIESEKAKEFIDKFEKSTAKSIDVFLSVNREKFEDIGKKAITLRILAAESVSKFRERLEKRDHDWYTHLFHKLTDGLTKENDYIHFGENSVSFITFNYDRSLEHFLYESFSNYFNFNGIPTEKIKEQLNKLRIIHVFGQVAGLEWQDLERKIEYRGDINIITVQKLIKNLRIIYDEEKNPELKEAHGLIRKAEHIFFLGFGYAKENLKLLKIPEILNSNQNIYGTALGLTSKEFRDIQNIFPFPTQIGHEDWDCLMLLRQHL